MKHSVPVCSEAKELVETGKIQLAEVLTLLCGLLMNFPRIHLAEICYRLRVGAISMIAYNSLWSSESTHARSYELFRL